MSPAHARPRAGSQLAAALVRRRWVREALPVVWLVAVTAVYLGPALHHGASLGPYDVLSGYGLTSHAHVAVHNVVGSDEIEEFIPWQSLAWTEVHAGHLPLWNPYTLLGTPLAFNFESAPFSLTVAIGYLFPLRLAHSATVVAALLLAGTGTYVLARVLRLGLVASLLAATTFELSGAFTIWLGWYEANVTAWLGWILAASVLLARGRRRARDVVLLALALAGALLAGEPQIAAVVLGSLALFAAVLALDVARRGSRRAARRVLLDHAIAGSGALALVAPVYLPGLQVALRSARSTGPKAAGLPLGDLTHLVFSSFNGVPTALSSVIGPDNLYVSMLYVGSIGLVLAVLGAHAAWSRAEARALVVLAATVAVAVFAPPVTSLFDAVHVLDVFRIVLATPVLDFSLAVLAGFGCDALVRGVSRKSRRVLGAAVVALAVAFVTLAVLLVAGADGLDAAQERTRALSFLWPALGLAACVVALAATRRGRAARGSARGRARAAALLLGLESATLVVAGAGIWSSSATAFEPAPAVAALRRLVGGALVGVGSCPATNAFPSIGILPDVNLDYEVHELAAYDPMTPIAYHRSYGAATGTSGAVLVPPGLFCPAITTAALARLYGVAYVLEAPGSPGPAGTRRVGIVGGEGVYAVPGAGRATLVPAAAHGAGRATLAPSSEPAPGTWRVVTDAAVPSTLRLRVTAEPGWHATIDGRPLALRVWRDVMLEAEVPPGRHVVVLEYLPSAFVDGLWCAAAALAAIVATPVLGSWRRRRRRRQGAGMPGAGAGAEGRAPDVGGAPATYDGEVRATRFRW